MCFFSLPQVADAGISVTIMCPGYVNTNLSLNAMRADGGKYGKMVRQNQRTRAREHGRHMFTSARACTHSLASLVLLLLLLLAICLCQDSSTAGGYEAEYVAALSYAALRQRIPEVVVADLSARIALMLQAIAPALLTQILIKRTRKERAKNANM
jgi:short-subunit dehydrogenase